MLHETRIHFQHRIVKTQFCFCRVAAQFNKRAPVDAEFGVLSAVARHWLGTTEHERYVARSV